MVTKGIRWNESETKKVAKANSDSEKLLDYLERELFNRGLADDSADSPYYEKDFGFMIYYNQGTKLFTVSPRRKNKTLHIDNIAKEIPIEILRENSFDLGSHNNIRVSTKEEIDRFIDLLQGSFLSNTEGSKMAVPFINIFPTNKDALWSFDFIKDIFEMLNITAPGDGRIAITVSKRKGKQVLHINYCNWLILGFAQESGQLVVRLPLIESQESEKYPVSFKFSQPEEEKVNCYKVPLEDLQPMNQVIKDLLEGALSLIKDRFQNYNGTPFRIYHVKEIEVAVFLEGKRKNLLENGVEVKVDRSKDIKYFWLTANPSIWSVNKIKGGGDVFYTAYNEKGNKRRIFNAFQQASPGDKILFYESTPVKEIIAEGEVTRGLHTEEENGFDEPVEGVSFRYIRDLPPVSWEAIISIEELEDCTPVKNGAQGSLFELTREEYETILSLTDGETEDKEDNTFEIPTVEFDRDIDIEKLHFEDKELIISQVKAALSKGKNIIFTGPPGTGKSKLAKEICNSFGAEYIMTTATSDWSTYETIGGYRPNPDGTLAFNQGLFLNCFKEAKTNRPLNKWLIIDEMNRADIDKAFGALFSALTGDPITLNFKSETGERVLVKPQSHESLIIPSDHEYIIPQDWRLIGSINTFDKASLYEMSYAFMRRFAFIPIGIPRDINEELVNSYLPLWGIEEYNYSSTLTTIWRYINEYRQIGPAIIEDIAHFTQESMDFTSAVILYVLPQFEGLMDEEILTFIEKLGGVEEIDKSRLLHFAIDFFHIKE